MGQEFFINSQELEDKVRQLLPSQGGGGAGFDLSASTQIIPIIDLTESAEGSNIRQDLQSSLSFSKVTSFSVFNSATTIINNTGYFRVFGTLTMDMSASESNFCTFALNDGSSSKIIWGRRSEGSSGIISTANYDFIVFLEAGDSLICDSDYADAGFIGSTRQIATIAGELVNP